MKKLLSIYTPPFAFNLATFTLRAVLGTLMIPHGYDKLVHFSAYRAQFMNFLGMGSTLSLGLVVLAEFFCSIFLIMGLFTRLASAILLIEMLVVVIKAHHNDVFGEGEMGMLFLAGYMGVLLLGAGKASLDGMLGR